MASVSGILGRGLTALSAALLFLALGGCGGGSVSGGAPEVTSITVAPLAYSPTEKATITVAGTGLGQGVVVTAPTWCRNLAAEPVADANRRTYTCTIEGAGEFAVKVLRASDRTLVSEQKLNVPKPQVTLTTTAGEIVLELEPSSAPLSVRNFLEYVDAGFYDGTIFHRVLTGTVLQGGGLLPGRIDKTEGLRSPITLESTNLTKLSNTEYTIAMARTNAANSATSQFFINVRNNANSFDYFSASAPGYAVFGRVVNASGQASALAMASAAVQGSKNDEPVVPETLITARRTQ